MKTSLLSLVAGAVFLAGSAIAGAAEPVALSDTQMDQVNAGAALATGFAAANAFGTNNARAQTATATNTVSAPGFNLAQSASTALSFSN